MMRGAPRRPSALRHRLPAISGNRNLYISAGTDDRPCVLTQLYAAPVQPARDPRRPAANPRPRARHGISRPQALPQAPPPPLHLGPRARPPQTPLARFCPPRPAPPPPPPPPPPPCPGACSSAGLPASRRGAAAAGTPTRPRPRPRPPRRSRRHPTRRRPAAPLAGWHPAPPARALPRRRLAGPGGASGAPERPLEPERPLVPLPFGAPAPRPRPRPCCRAGGAA